LTKKKTFEEVVSFFNLNGYEIISAEKYYQNTHSKVEFKCPNNHIDRVAVYHFFQNPKCSYCNGKKVFKDNCLSTLRPDIAKEWHPTLNGDLSPNGFTCGSKEVIWWKCGTGKNGHEWPASIKSRTFGRGCPYCDGKRACEDTCLATLRPDVAALWHPTLNGILTSKDVTCGSGKKVWWLCENGHIYQLSVFEMLRVKNPCKECNSLSFLCPNIAAQWNFTKNGDLIPKDFTCGSNEKVWWVCEVGHEWPAFIYNRCYSKSKKNGCPYCSGQKVCEDNCLSSLFPKLAKQWHPFLNGDFTPHDFTCGSKEEAWWVCEKGHEWPAVIKSRTSGKNCPYCFNRKVCDDNCLATLNPEVAKEWHPVKNGALTPKDFIVGSNKRVWWLCENGHEWKTDIYSRTKKDNPTGCSVCIEGSPVSKISQEWLDSLNIPKECREIFLPDLNYKVDAFVSETNTVYEFFGDYWHGNPDRFDRTQEHPVCKKTFGQLYEETKTRISRLKTAGYLLVYVWERDFNLTKRLTFSIK